MSARAFENFVIKFLSAECLKTTPYAAHYTDVARSLKFARLARFLVVDGCECVVVVAFSDTDILICSFLSVRGSCLPKAPNMNDGHNVHTTLLRIMPQC